MLIVPLDLKDATEPLSASERAEREEVNMLVGALHDTQASLDEARKVIAYLREMLGSMALLVKHKNCCDGADAHTTPEAVARVEESLALVRRTGRWLP